MSSCEEKCCRKEPMAVDQLQVGSHLKMGNDNNRLSIHASKSIVGLWLSNRRHGNQHDQIAMVSDNHGQTYFAVYPEATYWGPGVVNQLPFAVSTKGVQIPHQDGTVTHLSFAEISKMVRALTGKTE